ncbi:TPA: hypothetical protein N2952_002058 [Vibrio parahaemolyticus]|uniref:ProQ/FinO domain-containing protein n=1 Tax=Vibrio parahaemolyticus TaxID=670 RepID=A0A227JI50_VIBPH|nr:hypothetical protein [Vibrio parahaemolyticus]EGR0405595.1 hypothetical protein [Vibrio parahaemolyticus]ELJ8803536.1 hypothetical protein [Vibrio parahaemolyticus]ETX23640.1 hypothetical protein D037_2785 [Vibrio parahaemolyticus IDH02640]OXE34866.1 hypothetical protein CA163_00130 [Vibrio parahaemolyticus]HAS6842016.1 hypothetical protein [Vibrio parahaemolyticus]
MSEQKKDLRPVILWIKSFPVFVESKPVACSQILKQLFEENSKRSEPFTTTEIRKGSFIASTKDLRVLKATVSGDFDVFHDLYGNRIETYPIREDLLEKVREGIVSVKAEIKERKAKKAEARKAAKQAKMKKEKEQKPAQIEVKKKKTIGAAKDKKKVEVLVMKKKRKVLTLK